MSLILSKNLPGTSRLGVLMGGIKLSISKLSTLGKNQFKVSNFKSVKSLASTSAPAKALIGAGDLSKILDQSRPDMDMFGMSSSITPTITPKRDVSVIKGGVRLTTSYDGKWDHVTECNAAKRERIEVIRDMVDLDRSSTWRLARSAFPGEGRQIPKADVEMQKLGNMKGKAWKVWIKEQAERLAFVGTHGGGLHQNIVHERMRNVDGLARLAQRWNNLLQGRGEEL
ncbi:hypothetical protein OF83DRAFT_1089505 [Amylostereum chailletii]|nr:hypothetical protein OF83DRAFT_1089505 [Amylostereum chailletii]